MSIIKYTGLDVSEVRLLYLLIERGLNQDFLRSLFKIDEINWFLHFVSNKKINRLVEWINDTYIDDTNQSIAKSLHEDRELQYCLDHSDYCYFGYIQWLLKHKSTAYIHKMIEDEIDLSHEYGYEHYLTTEEIIDCLKNSDIHEFDEVECNEEDLLINKLNKMKVQSMDDMECDL